MPRWLEIPIALITVILLAPVYLFVILLIMLDSPGNPFFVQERVGLNGRRFHMLKFRKMAPFESREGVSVTMRRDPRLTRVGRFLEAAKLDEIPQFFNVLLGNMALVGPRPELPKFTNYHTDKWDAVLSVKPGVVGYAQIKNPCESILYPEGCVNPEAYYLEHILPEKLDIEIDYVNRRSTWLDFSIMIWVAFTLLHRIPQSFRINIQPYIREWAESNR
ncbi:MAG: sugar transferase [bacterium]|nr:sugar transferase [bacterium]